MSRPPSALADQLVRAGAGAGKTTALVDRVMELVQHYRQINKKWPRLVVTTFTRKATQELRERLTVKACQKNDLELLDYCRSRSRLHISTLHGVMGLFLRRYGHLLGLDPSYTILTEGGAKRLRRQVLREVLLENQQGSELLESYRIQDLEKMLRDYIEAQALQPQLEPLTEADILKIQADQAQVLAVDGKKIIAEVRAVTSNEKWLDYAGVLEQLILLLQGAWTIDKWALLNAVWEDRPNKPAFRKDKVNEVSAALDEQIKEYTEKLKKWLDDPGHSPAVAKRLSEQAQLFLVFAETYGKQFKKVKVELGQMEMSDLELFTLQSLREKPEIAEAFASDWEHWLIDEFQDTSPVQVELLKGLIHRQPRYVVGDPQQSIYLFRGARMEVFAEEEARVRDLGLQTELKLKNYRSTPSLLTFINDFFATVGTGFQPMEPRNFDFTPEKTVATFHQAFSQEGQLPRQEEYTALANHVEKLLRENNIELSDICILARKNKTLLEIAQFLKEWGYPTHVHASRGYSRRREVRDALALLRFLVHPMDNENILTLLRSPWCRVRDQELVAHLKKNKTSYWQQLLQSPLAQHPSLLRLQQSLEEALRFGFTLAWERALVRFCFIDLSSYHDATGRREANLWKLLSSLAFAERRPGFKILEFIDQAATVQADTESEDEGDAVTAVEPNVINLMTVHAAKGLQRRHVIIPHCDEGVKPSSRASFAFDVDSARWSVPIKNAEDDGTIHSPLAKELLQKQSARELQEQDRLLYVAVTRAQESVYLSWTGRPANHSWASRWRWPTEQDGTHERPGYRYQVKNKTEPLTKYSKNTSQVEVVRSLWQQSPRSPEGTMLSVSELLDKKMILPQTENITTRLEKAVTGTSLHRLLEQMRLRPDQDFARLAEAWFPQQADEVLAALHYVRELQLPPMGSLLKHGHAEWGFQLQLKNSILEGQIDLWGEVDGQIWLIDYKSGHPKALPKALAQLEIYAFALTRFGHQAPIRMAVIYPFHRRVEVRPFHQVSTKHEGITFY